MADYGNFLIKKFVLPHFRKGSKELHLLFDNTTGQQDSPKLFEQERRDTTMTDHQCVVFFDEAAVPTKWQQTINCRTCKGQLTSFLSTYIIQNIGPHLHDSQKYVTSGGMGTQVGKEVTRSGVSEPSVYKSDAPESDTRLWLHAKHSAGPKKFILSPDTDVYHIGMPLISADERIMVQLNRPSDKETKILDLTLLVDVLKSDPDLCHIPDDDIPLTIQALFVSTGCDYTSFFSGIGKAFFLQVFLDQSTFIVGSHPGHFSANFGSTTLSSQAQESELAFIRLVGCAYIKKHSNAFYGKTPQSLLHSFASASSPTEQHSQWLDHIRQGIWDRISLESESIPSFSALQLHWRRSCWVLHMWQQALSHSMELASLEGNGWKKAANGKLTVHWETEENMKKVKERVLLLMSGCGCKSGCKNMRCGCKRKSMSCGPGCRCTDCCNQETPPPTTLDNTERYVHFLKYIS